MPGMSASYRLRHRVRTPKRGTPTLMLLHWFLDTGSPNLLLVISIVLSIAGSVDAYLNAFFYCDHSGFKPGIKVLGI